ncbi:hypothetical protein MPTK1_6g11970 [Marchantia polymorpha subsp. ruderalis]|uniref:Uncharacterized protein n=2 Tax=Marchantia polymorpha TaxID=3197 RepID=A0AAF6BR33_MARPO|nr:hypothetical protein MARPO_0135s0039 [Marchantia polymorpha]BBN14467.1 hypothetical protein Mp_6g11970 [Marchantia polymorpha subsp. ruderalis]|eukprot:PTQ29757.1 hypothetical protein MARPO_0135s0039 [Marchantia polymorpha]
MSPHVACVSRSACRGACRMLALQTWLQTWRRNEAPVSLTGHLNVAKDVVTFVGFDDLRLHLLVTAFPNFRICSEVDLEPSMWASLNVPK